MKQELTQAAERLLLERMRNSEIRYRGTHDEIVNTIVDFSKENTKHLEEELGLLKIELSHTKTLLKSCEEALEKAHNTKTK
jgi:4-alpha-glucanotransferase